MLVKKNSVNIYVKTELQLWTSSQGSKQKTKEQNFASFSSIYAC